MSKLKQSKIKKDDSTLFPNFEKSAYNFIEELRNIPVDLCLIPPSELKKLTLFTFCVKNLMSSVRKNIEDFEERAKKKTESNKLLDI